MSLFFSSLPIWTHPCNLSEPGHAHYTWEDWSDQDGRTPKKRQQLAIFLLHCNLFFFWFWGWDSTMAGAKALSSYHFFRFFCSSVLLSKILRSYLSPESIHTLYLKIDFVSVSLLQSFPASPDLEQPTQTCESNANCFPWGQASSL